MSERVQRIVVWKLNGSEEWLIGGRVELKRG